VLEVLGKRLGRYGLTLHPDKTRFIDFRPERRGGTHPDCKEPPFDFLGFTHTWVKSRKGKNVVRQTTAKSRLARALVAIKDWCRTNRHWPVLAQHAKLSTKMRGHFAYYGITGNSRRLQRYHPEVSKTWRKWLARRTRSKRLQWARFNAFLARPAASGKDRPPLCHLKPSSPAKNRMREICASGTVRGEGPHLLGPCYAVYAIGITTPNNRAAFTPMIFSLSAAVRAQDSTNSIGFGSPTG
jgi:hypothetical protein